MKEGFILNIQLLKTGISTFLDKTINLADLTSDKMKEIYNYLEPLFEQYGYRSETISSNPNILVIVGGGIGDSICASNIFVELKAVYPDSQITMICSSSTVKEVYEHCDLISDIIEIPIALLDAQDDLSSDETKEFFSNLLDKRYEIAYVLAWDPILSFWSYLGGCKYIHALEIDEEHPLLASDHEIQQDQINYAKTIISEPYSLKSNEHIAEAFSNMIRKNSVPIHNHVWITDNDKEAISKYVTSDKNIMLGIFADDPRKEYPYYDEVIEKLHELDPEFTFYLIGATNDLRQLKKVDEMAKLPNVVSLINKLKIRESIAILEKCKYCITNDTWLVHAVSAYNIPTINISCYATDKPLYKYSSIVLFRPLNIPSIVIQPKVALGPECKTAKSEYIGCAADGAHCIKSIDSETIVTAFKELQNLTEVTTLYRS